MLAFGSLSFRFKLLSPQVADRKLLVAKLAKSFGTWTCRPKLLASFATPVRTQSPFALEPALMPDSPPLVNVIGIGLLVASLIAWVRLLVRWKRGQSSSVIREDEPIPNPHWASALMALLSISLALSTLGMPKKEPAADYGIGNVQAVCATTALMGVIVALPLLLDQQTKPSRLGFHGRHLAKQLQVGCWGYALTVGPVALVYLLMAPFRSPESQHQLLKLIAAQPTFETLFWVSLAAVVCAPMVEELLYRVVLQSVVRILLPHWAAILLTAIIFSAVHRWPDAVPLLPLALVLGAVYDTTRSYWSVVTLHMLFNTTNILLLWLTVTAAK